MGHVSFVRLYKVCVSKNYWYVETQIKCTRLLCNSSARYKLEEKEPLNKEIN